MNTFKAVGGPKAEERARDAWRSVSGADEAWEPLMPLETPELPAFPVHLLPPACADMVNAVSRSLQVPVDIPALMMLSVLATATQGVTQLHVGGDWFEETSLYTITRGESGCGKSPVYKEIVAPLREHQQERNRNAARTRRHNETAFGVIAARIATLERAGARTEADDDRQSIIDQMNALKEQLPAMPPDRQYLAEDATAEGVVDALQKNKGRIAFFSAEGGLVRNMLGRYSSGSPNIEVYLKGYSGEPIPKNRVKDGWVDLPRANVSIGLSVQGNILADLVNCRECVDRGLTARFCYALPPSLVGTRDYTHQQDVPPAVRAVFLMKVGALLAIPEQEDEDGCLEPHVVTFTAAAHQKLRAFMQQREPRIGKKGDLGLMTEWMSKLHGQAARIAGNLHLADRAGLPGFWKEPVSEHWVDVALEIVDYLIPHAWAAHFLAKSSDGEAESEAQHLLRWMTARNQETFTQRDVFEANRGTFGKIKETEPALTTLLEFNHIRLLPNPREGKRGRPSFVFQVHPDLLTAEPLRQAA